MTNSLYEELLSQAPKKKLWYRKVNKEIKKKLEEEASIQGDEIDKLLSPEEVKEKKRQERKKAANTRRIQNDYIRAKKKQQDLIDKYGIYISRMFIYTEDLEEIVANYRDAQEEYYKKMDTSNIHIRISPQDEEDFNYIQSTKEDRCRGNNRWFSVDWFQWTIPNSDARRKVKINFPIRVANTYSANHIYGYLIKSQQAAYEYLDWFAKKYSLTVEEYVKANFKEEDYHTSWKIHRGLYRPIEYATKWSWLDVITKGVQVRLRRLIFYYIRLIYEGKFMLWEACLPFTTYLSWDYIYLGSNWCMVASLTGNGEIFNEENRRLIHQWWVMASVPTKKYSLFDRIPLFYWDDMIMVKISSAKLREDEWWIVHNNWQYSLYITPRGEAKWENVLTRDTSLEWVQDKFNAPTYEECLIEYSDWAPTLPSRDIQMNPSTKKNVLVYDTSEE